MLFSFMEVETCKPAENTFLLNTRVYLADHHYEERGHINIDSGMYDRRDVCL